MHWLVFTFASGARAWRHRELCKYPLPPYLRVRAVKANNRVSKLGRLKYLSAHDDGRTTAAPDTSGGAVHAM